MSLLSTVSTLVEEIGERLNENTADTGVGDRYLEWINSGMYDIATQIPDASYLEKTVTATLANSTADWKVSGFASDIDHFVALRISAQESNVKYVTPEQMDLIDPQRSDTGVPSLYTVFEDKVSFYPTPDSDYGLQVKYIKDVATVSAASATPEVPKKYLESIVLYGVTQGLYKREDYQQAQIMEAKYRAMVDRMKKDLSDKSSEIKRMLDIREIQRINKGSSDEIVRAFWS